MQAEVDPATGHALPAPTGSLPLVARDLELLEIGNCLDHAARGVGNVVLVLGVAGIGKTRLARESVLEARDRGFACAWGSPWPDGDAAPLWPWPSIVEQLGASAAALGRRRGEAERFGQFRAVGRALERAASRQPVLVVLDDVDRADPAAVLLARFVIRAMSAAPVTFLLTARPRTGDQRDTTLGDVARDAVVVRPRSLPRAALGELLRTMGRPASGDRLTELLELTGGIPQLVSELSTAAPGRDAGTSLRAVLERRIEQFDAPTQQALAAVAVLGRHASDRAVAKVVAMTTVSTVVAADDDASRLAWALDAGERAGVLHRGADGTLTFGHRPLADALLDRLSADDRADLHDAAAAALVGGTPYRPSADLLAAIADQRIAACRTAPSLSPAGSGGGDRLGAALDASSVAAAALARDLAYESAAALLMEVIDLNDQRGATTPVPLLLQLAQCELAAGRLRAARPWFRRAADAANDPIELAEAAIGLGGIWVHEHRRTVEHAKFTALLDRAIDSLAKAGDPRPDLRARLRVRRAAEALYTGSGDVADVADELAAARAVADPVVLAECLSLAHHTMLGPAQAHDRGPVADELLAVAAGAGGDLQVLLGVMWRPVDLILYGDPRAVRALADLTERADALQVAAVSFVAQAIDVMRQIRAGRFADAEIAAESCFALGTEIGDADAFGYFGAHLLTLRWLQCREDEILPFAREVSASPDLVESDVTFPAALAVVAAKAGRTAEATAALSRVLGRSAASAEVSSNWLVSMFCATEAAAALGDQSALGELYEAVGPYADLPVMGSLGVICLGSAQRVLGVAALGLGRIDAAVDHFAAALQQNRRLGNQPMLAITAGDLGLALVRRARAGDVDAGLRYVSDATAALDSMGLGVRADALRSAIDDLQHDTPPAGSATLQGDTWVLVHGPSRVEVADSIGVQRLAQLLARPHVDIAASDLAGSIAETAAQPMLDREALRAYRDKVDELRAEIDDAEADNDLASAEHLREQLDTLLEHLSVSSGLRGRSRSFAGGDERARVAVRKSLRRVFDEIAAAAPEFGAQLQASIRTGHVCRFEPVAGLAPEWHVHAEN